MDDDFRPRIDKDIEKLVAKHADANGRSPTGEVNHVLRVHYAQEAQQLRNDQRSFGSVCAKKK